MVVFREKIFRRALELYAGHHVADFVDKKDGKIGLGGFKTSITSYIQDLYAVDVNLSGISPKLWTDFLQAYLNATCEAILIHQGTLDHIEGENLKAFWGAPIEQKDHTRRAVLAAIEASRQFGVTRAEIRHSEIDKLRISIGLHTGDAVVGNFGCKYRYTYTALGETVKMAAVMRSLGMSYGVETVITDAVYRQTSDLVIVRELDRFKLSESQKMITLYEIKGLTDEHSMALQTVLNAFSRGLQLFRERKWDEASDYFFAVLKTDKNDRPAKVFVERCTNFKHNPPPQNWDGSFEIKG